MLQPLRLRVVWMESPDTRAGTPIPEVVPPPRTTVQRRRIRLHSRRPAPCTARLAVAGGGHSRRAGARPPVESRRGSCWRLAPAACIRSARAGPDRPAPSPRGTESAGPVTCGATRGRSPILGCTARRAMSLPGSGGAGGRPAWGPGVPCIAAKVSPGRNGKFNTIRRAGRGPRRQVALRSYIYGNRCSCT
jgi:hypothetical protein